jgi:hypothetical protein
LAGIVGGGPKAALRSWRAGHPITGAQGFGHGCAGLLREARARARKKLINPI